MNTSITRVPTEFGPEARFAVIPTPSAPFRAWQETQLEELKHRLLNRQLENIWEPELNSSVRRAANEAAALAWVSPYPLLVFPVLFEEKAAAAVNHAERQVQVRRVTRELLAV